MNYLTNSNNAIRVLHIITRLIVGGAQENTMYTAQLLDKSRFDVEIVSGPQTGSEGSLIEEVRQRRIPLSIISELVRNLNPFYDLSALVKLVIHIRKAKYAIVHTHSSKAGILGRLAARIAGVPVIIHTVHGWSFHGHMTQYLQCFYIFLERFTAHFTDKLITVAASDIDKGLKEKIGSRNQYTMIRSAIPLEEYDLQKTNREEIRQSLDIPLDAPLLGNVGRFSAQKNPFGWIKIAGEVSRRIPNCYFLMVGDGPLRQEAQNLIEAEGIQNKVIATGLRRDVTQLLSAMDVFLLTSLWEGLPRVIPQAMMMKLPIVAYRTDGTVEAIIPGETGYLCNPGDISMAANYCTQLLSDPDLCHRMGEKAKHFASLNFDLKQMITQIENIYTELLSNKGLI